MTTARIEKRYYNAESPEASDIYALMQITTELPPAPYAGMEVRTGRSFLKLERISWDADEQKFSCTATRHFLTMSDCEKEALSEYAGGGRKYSGFECRKMLLGVFLLDSKTF